MEAMTLRATMPEVLIQHTASRRPSTPVRRPPRRRSAGPTTTNRRVPRISTRSDLTRNGMIALQVHHYTQQAALRGCGRGVRGKIDTWRVRPNASRWKRGKQIHRRAEGSNPDTSDVEPQGCALLLEPRLLSPSHSRTHIPQSKCPRPRVVANRKVSALV